MIQWLCEKYGRSIVARETAFNTALRSHRAILDWLHDDSDLWRANFKSLVAGAVSGGHVSLLTEITHGDLKSIKLILGDDILHSVLACVGAGHAAMLSFLRERKILERVPLSQHDIYQAAATGNQFELLRKEFRKGYALNFVITTFHRPIFFFSFPYWHMRVCIHIYASHNHC